MLWMYPQRRKICVSLYIRHVAVGCHHHQTQCCIQLSLAAWHAPTDQVKLAQHPPAATRMQDIILFPVQQEASDALRRGELRPCSDTNISADLRHKAGMLCKPALFLGKGLAVGLNNKVVGMQRMRLLAGVAARRLQGRLQPRGQLAWTRPGAQPSASAPADQAGRQSHASSSPARQVGQCCLATPSQIKRTIYLPERSAPCEASARPGLRPAPPPCQLQAGCVQRLG